MSEKVKVKLYDVQTIEVTPQILAEAFYAMDNIEQVDFFEAMAEVWKDKDFDNQMLYVSRTLGMSNGAREIMRIIGLHSGG